MKIKTNAGEVELTAEMVCRGMVFTAADYHLGGGLFVVGRRDDANNVWRDAGDDGLGTNLLGAQRFLGCDPTVASRADCERFGVHGDAAAHGFARLRDGGAVDLYRVPLAGLVTEDGVGQRRAFEDPATCFADERFLGLDSRHASPEDVRRLCCGAEHLSNEQYDPHLCTLAIGDHDEHEDLATGVKWSARKVQFYDRVDIHLDGKPLREDLYPRRLAALADGISGDAGGLYVPALPIPTCGCCGKATEPSRIGPTMLVLPVGDCLTAEAPICRSCLVDVNEDIAAWTIRDGKIERKVRAACPNCGGDDATCRGSLAGLKACAAKGAQWGVADIVSGKALDGLALLYDEKRRAGETCEDLRARLRRIHARGPGFRVGVDHAQPGTEATAFVSAAMRKAGESLARVGEAAKWGAGRCPACNGILPVHEARCPLIGRAPAAIEWRHGSASLGQSQAHRATSGHLACARGNPMTRSLTAEETAALPPMPLGLPVDLPITLREVVWASAYAADFARQFAEIRSAVDPGPTRDELATSMVNVARCKTVADAAVEGMGGPARYNDCSAEEREALLATDEAVRADLSKRTPAELDTLSALCEAKR